jgi:hypothetical protein
MLLLVLALLASTVMIGAANYQKGLLKAKGIAKDEFIQLFTSLGVAAEVAASVYDYYQQESGAAAFQVSPQFSLRAVFRKSHEDVDEDVTEILRELRIELPPESILREWPGPLLTVRDVVNWISWVRERRSSNRQLT